MSSRKRRLHSFASYTLHVSLIDKNSTSDAYKPENATLLLFINDTIRRIKSTNKTTFTIGRSILYSRSWSVFRVLDCIQDMLVIGIKFIFVVEETEVCVVLLLCLHHYFHLNAVLRYESCRAFYYRMHFLCLRLQQSSHRK